MDVNKCHATEEQFCARSKFAAPSVSTVRRVLGGYFFFFFSFSDYDAVVFVQCEPVVQNCSIWLPRRPWSRVLRVVGDWKWIDRGQTKPIVACSRCAEDWRPRVVGAWVMTARGGSIYPCPY